MLTRETVQEILQPLRDPETGKSLMELQRIRDIVVKERTVRLSVTYSSVRASLEAQIREILEAMGAEDIHIRMRPLDNASSQANREEANDRDKLTKGHAPVWSRIRAKRAIRRSLHCDCKRQRRRRQIHRYGEFSRLWLDKGRRSV